MSWTDQLETCSFAGIEFDIQALDDDLVRRLSEYRYPYRNGADFDDVGREPRTTRVTAVFWGEDYLPDLNALLKEVDKGEASRFVHPLLGAWSARARRIGVHHEHASRDYASVDLEFVEDGTDTTLPDVVSLASLEAEVSADADALDEVNTEEIEQVTLAATDARTFAENAASYASELADQVNAVRKRIDNALAEIAALTDMSSWPLVRACKKLAYSCKRLADRALSLRPPMILKRLETAMPLSLLSHRLYGDRTHYDEILSNNRVRNPFIVPAGTELKVYAR